MKMEKLFVAAVIAITLGFMTTVEADRCMCPVKHPQQKFCEADFVFVATVRGAVDVESFLIYDMHVSRGKVFKGEEFLDLDDQYTNVFTDSSGVLCGWANLVHKEKYLISGMIVDGQLEISHCDWIVQWKDLSQSQIEFLKRGKYADQCDNSCNLAGVYSAHHTDMNDDANTYHESQLSGKWSRYHCTFNPVASWTYMKYDCETEFAFCTRDVVTDTCMWKINEKYSDCFNTRETAWVFHREKEAAFTNIRQCRSLSNKRWKKKCFRAVMKYRRSTRDRSAIEELPIPT